MLETHQTRAQAWFELILHNLLYNAVSHSVDGSVVTLKVTSDAGFCMLEILIN